MAYYIKFTRGSGKFKDPKVTRYLNRIKIDHVVYYILHSSPKIESHPGFAIKHWEKVTTAIRHARLIAQWASRFPWDVPYTDIYVIESMTDKQKAHFHNNGEKWERLD